VRVARGSLVRRGSELVDTREIVVVEHLRLEREPAARPILDPAPPTALEQLVARDPEHPRSRRTRSARAEPPGREEDRREHLGRERHRSGSGCLASHQETLRSACSV